VKPLGRFSCRYQDVSAFLKLVCLDPSPQMTDTNIYLDLHLLVSGRHTREVPGLFLTRAVSNARIEMREPLDHERDFGMLSLK